MARPRLKTPQGQRSSEPGKDEKAQKAEPPAKQVAIASPFRTTDPARFLYESFAESHGWRDPRTASGKMKKWEELSVHDRRAWAVVNEHMFQASGRVSVRIPPEDGSTVLILRRRGGVFAVEEVPITSLVKIADVRKVMAILDTELTRLESEYADAEMKKWHINEPKKFEAPK